MKKLFITTGLLLAGLAAFAQNGPVKIWEGVENLPTYRVNAPEQAPLFERDFAYQRAKRGVYPYAMNDNPTIEKVDSAHRAVYLENDYVKVCDYGYGWSAHEKNIVGQAGSDGRSKRTCAAAAVRSGRTETIFT